MILRPFTCLQLTSCSPTRPLQIEEPAFWKSLPEVPGSCLSEALQWVNWKDLNMTSPQKSWAIYIYIYNIYRHRYHIHTYIYVDIDNHRYTFVCRCAKFFFNMYNWVVPVCLNELFLVVPIVSSSKEDTAPGRQRTWDCQTWMCGCEADWTPKK